MARGRRGVLFDIPGVAEDALAVGVGVVALTLLALLIINPKKDPKPDDTPETTPAEGGS